MSGETRPDGAASNRRDVLVVQDVAHSFGSTRALDGVTFSLTPGITALLGVNGAGKSTLLSVASGALKPSSGQVSLQGHQPYGRQRREALRSVALMPQSTTFPATMTCREVVQYIGWMRGMSARAARRGAIEVLGRVALGDRVNSKVGHLSGGMLRRLALAQALVSDAPVLLLDEPTTGLDPAHRRQMVDLIGGLRGTVLLSSHMLEDVADVAERIIALDHGKIVFSGSVPDLQALAPAGSDPHRRAELGFLSLLVHPRPPSAR